VTIEQPQDRVADRTAVLVVEWRNASLAGLWRYGDDWDCPEAWLLAAEVVRGTDGIPSAGAALGAARARQGIDIPEALGDLQTLFRAALNTPAPDLLTQALTEGWSEELGSSPWEWCSLVSFDLRF
jgi:hypothetical protein